MGRPGKLWRRKDRPGWWATIHGKQVPLGEDRVEAEREWHRLRGSAPESFSRKATIAELVDAYLAWAQNRVKAATWQSYRGYLQSWVNHAGRLPVASVAIGHVQDWVDGQGWNQSSRSLALSILR